MCGSSLYLILVERNWSLSWKRNLTVFANCCLQIVNLCQIYSSAIDYETQFLYIRYSSTLTIAIFYVDSSDISIKPSDLWSKLDGGLRWGWQTEQIWEVSICSGTRPCILSYIFTSKTMHREILQPKCQKSDLPIHTAAAWSFLPPTYLLSFFTADLGTTREGHE